MAALAPGVALADSTTVTTTVSQVVVTASRVDLLGRAVTASQGKVTEEEIKLRPACRVGQLLESVPGLVVSIHSGEGNLFDVKANAFAYYCQTMIPGDPPGGESDNQNHPLEPISARFTVTASF